MAKPISLEKRADIIRHMQAGRSKADIAEWLFVCVRTVTRVWNKFITVGSYGPEPQNSGRKPLVSNEAMEHVVEKIKEVPDMTLIELIDEFNLQISQAALSKRLIKLGLTYKKRRSIQKTGGGRMSLKQGRHGAQSRAK
jgi:transposase